MLAVALRCLNTASDTPSGFPQQIRSWVRAHTRRTKVPWRILWYGVGSSKKLSIPLRALDDEQLYCYGSDSYKTQLAKLAGCDLAVGLNSGGLDLAAAAGVPVLRLGAFAPKRYAQTKTYNDFLANTTHVTVWCDSPKKHVYSVRRWLHRMMELAHVNGLSVQRHLVVSPGAAVTI